MTTIRTQGGKVVTVGGKVSCICCNNSACRQEVFFISGISLNRCAAVPYGTRTITRPLGAGIAPAPNPVLVSIRGTVDDELLVDGFITQQGQFPFINGCNGAHSVTVDFITTAVSFTIAAGDNHGTNSGYDIEICFENPSAP